MARIQVPKKGTFACDSSTAEEAIEYLRQVSLGRLRWFKSGWEGPGKVLWFALGCHRFPRLRLDEPWHGNVLLSCGPHKLEPKQQLQEFNADFVPWPLHLTGQRLVLPGHKMPTLVLHVANICMCSGRKKW